MSFEATRAYTRVLVSGAVVYAVSGLSIYCMPLDKSAPPIVVATASGSISGIVIDDQSVYWTDAGSSTTGGLVRKIAR